MTRPVWRQMRALVATVLAVVLAASAPATADVRIENEMRAAAQASAPGLELYRYGTGTPQVADFSAGATVSTVESSGSLELDLADLFADWWDTDWGRRQCFEVTSTDAESEYPLQFEVDTSGTTSTGADIRVVEGTNGTLLTSYSEGPFPSTTSVVWAQAEPLPSGTSTYCVYFDNTAAATVSDQEGVFTYTTRTISYYTLSNRYDGTNGNGGRLTVVSYADDNEVSDGTTTVTLDAGDFHTFRGIDKDTIITATAPIEGNFDRDGRETIIPESYADTQFSFPTRRYEERFWVRSLGGETVVQAVSNGVVIDFETVGPDASVVLDAPGPDDQPVSIRSTDGTPIVAMHIGTNNQDSMIGVPFLGETVYGVPSRWLNLGAIEPTTVSWIRSDGLAIPNQQVRIDALTAIGGNGDYGRLHAVAVTGSEYFIAAQQADRDGTETTTFLPKSLLNQTYRLPVASRYFAVACPTPGTMITVDGGTPVACNGTGVGHYDSGFGPQAAGTLIEADHPIYVYYETNGGKNETNLLGGKASIPRTTSVTQVAQAVEDQSMCGTWTSPVLPVAGVFGTVSITQSLLAGTSSTFQISTDGSAFYGADGTDATSFAEGDIVPYLADDATMLRLRVELCTTEATVSPTLDDFEIESDLVEVAPDLTNVIDVPLASPATGTDEPLFRVYQRAAGDWTGAVSYTGGSNFGVSKVELSSDHPAVHVSSAGGVVSAPSPSFSHRRTEPYTLRAAHKTDATEMSTLDIRLSGTDGVRVGLGVRLTFTG